MLHEIYQSKNRLKTIKQCEWDNMKWNVKYYL